ncbi:unnamed protein product, partial [Prorocentrum cordatum]
MKSIESDYVAQVAALQHEKQELVAQVAQLKHAESACGQQTKRAADLEGMLIREEDARRRAEERARQLEQACAGSAQGQQTREEDLRLQLIQVQGRLAREEQARRGAEERAAAAVERAAVVERAAAEGAAAAPAALVARGPAGGEEAARAARIAELEAEVAAHAKRNAELNTVIQSVQDREKRIAQLERALVAPSAPVSPHALGPGGRAAPGGTGPPSAWSAPAASPLSPLPQLGGSQPAGTGAQIGAGEPSAQGAAGSRGSAAAPAAQPAPASVEAVAGRSSAATPLRWPAEGTPRQASPMRLSEHAGGPQRAVSPMRVVQVFSTQGAPGRQSAVSPIRVLGTRDGPVRESVREIRREFRGRLSTTPQAPGAAAPPPRARGPAEAARPAGGEPGAGHLPPWIEAPSAGRPRGAPRGARGAAAGRPRGGAAVAQLRAARPGSALEPSSLGQRAGLDPCPSHAELFGPGFRFILALKFSARLVLFMQCQRCKAAGCPRMVRSGRRVPRKTLPAQRAVPLMPGLGGQWAQSLQLVRPPAQPVTNNLSLKMLLRCCMRHVLRPLMGGPPAGFASWAAAASLRVACAADGAKEPGSLFARAEALTVPPPAEPPPEGPWQAGAWRWTATKFDKQELIEARGRCAPAAAPRGPPRRWAQAAALGAAALAACAALSAAAAAPARGGPPRQ